MVARNVKIPILEEDGNEKSYAEEMDFLPENMPFDDPSVLAKDVKEAIIESKFSPEFDPQKNIAILYDDFNNMITWSPSTSGAGASASVSSGNATFASGKHLGVAQILTGTVLSSHAALVQSSGLSNSIVFGNGLAVYQTLIRIPTLATASDDYVFRCGLGTATNADHSDGVYFEYNRGTSVNWILKTASGSVRTSSVTSTIVAAAAWIHLKYEVNEAGNSVEFFIGGVSVGTITTNIPTATGAGCGPNYQISNIAVVAGARNVFIDYFYFYKKFTARD